MKDEAQRKPRPPCPFYGFRRMNDTLTQSIDNHCGLAQEPNKRCLMETAGGKAEWNKCKLIAVMANRGFPVPIDERLFRTPNRFLVACVFPVEFRPAHRSGWSGFPLDEWFKYVTGPECPRPK